MNRPLDMFSTSSHQPNPITYLLSNCTSFLQYYGAHYLTVSQGNTSTNLNLEIIEKIAITLRVFMVINSEESILPAFISFAIFPNPTGCRDHSNSYDTKKDEY